MSKYKKVKIMNPKFLYIACLHKVSLIKKVRKTLIMFPFPLLAKHQTIACNVYPLTRPTAINQANKLNWPRTYLLSDCFL